jgi:ribonuclease J
MVVVGRSLKRIEKIARLSGYFSELPAFIDDKKINSFDPLKILIVCTGSQGEENSALSKISGDEHRSVKLCNSDVVIFSSRVIPGNESAVTDIQNALIKKNVKIITDLDYEVHASGHPSKKELEHLYSLAKPCALIPVHGETVQLYKHAEIAKEYGIKNVLIPQDGCVIKLSGKKPEITDRLNGGVLGVDGNKLIPIDGAVYKQRKLLSMSGVVSVLVRYQKLSVSITDFQCFGIFENSEQAEIDDIKNDIASAIKLSLENTFMKKLSHQDIRSNVEKIIRSMFLDARGKKPIIFVHIAD